jgi:oligopeptide/dipeptide ABC transporter ATP-binding protein
MSPAEPLLVVSDLIKRFADKRSPVDRWQRREPAVLTALDGVDIVVAPGETLGIVGESGSGKSTLARCIVRLHEPDSGSVIFDGTDVLGATGSELRELRRDMQMVYQDPYTSLNPRIRIGAAVAEPARVHGLIEKGEEEAYAAELLERVGIGKEAIRRYPHEFSGGQRQRIGVARALALNPQLIILDEPVSALDVSIRAQVVNLLESLQRDFGLTYIFVAHDLSVVRHVSDHVAVMYLGKVVETGTKHQIYDSPAHPYTQALLSAVPIEEPTQRGKRKRIVLEGDVPSPANPPSGCRFRTRCWKAQEICATEEPALIDRGQGHPSACHFAEVVKPLDISG